MWRIVDCAKVAVLCLGLMSGFMLATPAQALDTTLNVQVCGTTAFSRLEITSPQSDTVLRESPMRLTGEVELINQIDIYIDDAYHKVVAIPRGEIEFDTAVSLRDGTQTVEVRGVGICDNRPLQDEVVITYDPPASPSAPAEPSEGSRTPTVTSPTPGTGSQPGGGVVVSNPSPTDDDTTPDNGGSWWQTVLGWLGANGLSGWVIRLTDVDTTVQRLSADWVRIVALIGGMALLLWATMTAGLRRGLRAGLLIGGSVLLLASVLVFL